MTTTRVMKRCQTTKTTIDAIGCVAQGSGCFCDCAWSAMSFGIASLMTPRATRPRVLAYVVTPPLTTNLLALSCAQLKPATQPGGSHKILTACSGSKVRRCLKKGSTPDGSGPGALDLLSAQLFSFRWPASNDSEAFDDAVATSVHSLYFSQSYDS